MRRSYLVLICTALLVLSCALESKYALPKKETIDPALLGTWAFTTDDGTDEFLRIEAKDDMTYKIILEDDVVLAHTATIKGHRIMNLIESEDEDQKPNIFYGFELKRNKLTIMEVTDQLKVDDFGSQQELIQFFNDNIDRTDFFINPDVLKRKKYNNSLN